MRYLIPFIIFTFVVLAFLGTHESLISNPFIAYLFYLSNIALSNIPYVIIFTCIIFLILIKPFLSRKHIMLKTISHTFIQLITLLFIGIFTSFIILILIAFIELNIFSIILNIDPKYLGVKTGTNEIISSIKINNKPPLIIASDKNSQNEVIAIAKATAGTTNFYGSKILSSVPKILILPTNTKSNLLFLDNTLVVKSIDSNNIQKISPIIGYQIIKNYSPQRQIKSYPKVSVMDEQSYLLFRKEDALEKQNKVDVEIEKTDSAISSFSAAIQLDKDEIALNNTSQQNVLKERDTEHNACLNQGVYKLGIFYPKNSNEFCKQILDKWELIFIEEKKKENELNKRLELNEIKLKEYQYFNNYFKAQQKLMGISSSSIPSELGLYDPSTNTIKIIVNSSSTERIVDYFQSLSHEYLHYTSYTPGKRFESSFFEEALTEYFARRAIKGAIQVDTNLGYPVSVKLIEEISKKISDPDLEEIYFNKDQIVLEKTLNLAYGEDFYKKNIVLFESLQYTADPDQLLTLVNIIMQKLGGNSLKKSDVFSSSSKL